MIDLLQLGFTYIGSCHCSGAHNKKYQRGEWLIYLTSKRFKVKKNGSTVKAYTDLENLEAYLQQAIPWLFTRKQIQD